MVAIANCEKCDWIAIEEWDNMEYSNVDVTAEVHRSHHWGYEQECVTVPVAAIRDERAIERVLDAKSKHN